MGKLGRGGYSSVYKTKHIIDDSFYAIKKIKMKIDNSKSAKDFEEEIQSVLQEIRLLAKYKNECIVNYNHSWVEVKLKSNVILN